MTTMLRLAKRSETTYSGKLIYLENENRKIVFSSKDLFASILAVGCYDSELSDNGGAKKGYHCHSTLGEATNYRRAAGNQSGIITIDREGFIYDIDLNLGAKAALVMTKDKVALSPFSFLKDYKDISDAYNTILELANKASNSKVLAKYDKDKAYQLKELAYKVITLFKHTHELSVSTCMEFNDDFFNPTPLYAEKTLVRINILVNKLALLVGESDVYLAEVDGGSQSQRDNIDHAVNNAIERALREEIRHSDS